MDPTTKLEREPSIWHREVPGTSWMRMGGYLPCVALVGVGIFDLLYETASVQQGWYADTAKWMGMGSWFQWLLTGQMALAGLIALLSAQKWLHDRSKLTAQVGLWGGLFGAYLGASHAPVAGRVDEGYWIQYGIRTALLLGATVTYMYRAYAQHRRVQPGA